MQNHPVTAQFGVIKYEMRLIPAGSFVMGCDDEARETKHWIKDHSIPRHEVVFEEPFHIGVYPVSQEQWETVMGKNPSFFKGPTNPVECVSWVDCQKFITKMNEMDATDGTTKFRLPSEAEWEYACRAGTTTRYCFGDTDGQLSGYAWYGSYPDGSTHPVGQKQPNAWGLYDMHGNVWEWCQDNSHDDYHGAPTDGRAWEPGSGEYRAHRIVRGGAWDCNAVRCASASRNGLDRRYRCGSLGLRLAMSV